MAKGDRYVEVSRVAFLNALVAAGFTEYPARGELVYYRRHHLDQTMMVKVYTSLPREGEAARDCGKDAIRVLLVFERDLGGTAGKVGGCLHKAPRVYRTGSEQAVIERTLERARECYGEANKRYRERQERLKGGNR